MQPRDALACGGAPGKPKPGSEGIINFGSSAVQGILDELTEGTSAIAFATLFGGATYNGTEFCAAGDVGDPGMSAQDWSDALDVTNPVVNGPARTKAQHWFQHVIFPIICDCSDGTAPPAATPPGPPPVTTSPNTQPYTTGPNCWQHEVKRLPNYANQQAYNFNDCLPDIGPGFNDGTFLRPNIQSPTPAGIVISFTVGTEGSDAAPAEAIINWNNATGGNINPAYLSPVVPPGNSFTSPMIAIPSGAVFWDIIATGNPIGNACTNTVDMTATIYCQGQSPTGVNSPCCPPDPSVDLRLGQLLEMMTQLLSLQSLAGAYQDTIRHASLSGDGTITINPASSAIRVEVRTDLSSWPQNPQTPTYFYSLGFITPYAVGTPLKGQRLVYDRQTFTWPSYTDQIGYALAPGVTVDLVELTRGA